MLRLVERRPVNGCMVLLVKEEPQASLSGAATTGNPMLCRGRYYECIHFLSSGGKCPQNGHNGDTAACYGG